MARAEMTINTFAENWIVVALKIPQKPYKYKVEYEYEPNQAYFGRLRLQFELNIFSNASNVILKGRNR